MGVQTNYRTALSVVAATVLSACAGAGTQTSPLEGAWKVVRINLISDTVIQRPPASLYLFAGGHYSMMRVLGDRPRALIAGDTALDVEKIAAFDSFIANSGTYEVADSTLTIHPVVARMQNFAQGGSDQFHFRISGDTLWLSNTGRAQRSIVAGKMNTSADSAYMTVLVRQK